MKIINTKTKMNETSFAPELEVVVRLPLEPTADNKVLDAAFYEKIGREFFALLEQKGQNRDED